MDHYQIITDLAELEAFVDWLPEISGDECYYIELFCRRKYDSDMPSSKSYNINRRIVEEKSRLIRTIQKFEVPLGSYLLREQEVSQGSLAIYITTNPRNQRKAAPNMVRTILQAIESGNQVRLHSMAMTEIHRTKSKSNFVTWDVDQKSEDLCVVIDYVKSLVGAECFNVIETRGGFHLIVEVDKVQATVKDWYNSICNGLNYDQKGDIMSPIPGCVQGPIDFTPRMIVRNGLDIRMA